MSEGAFPSAILFWTSESKPGLAASGDAERLNNLDLNQRVVRVLDSSDGWATVRYGQQDFRVRCQCLKPVNAPRFEVGDPVRFDKGVAMVRDVIWHFKNAEPNYYLAANGKSCRSATPTMIWSQQAPSRMSALHPLWTHQPPLRGMTQRALRFAADDGSR